MTLVKQATSLAIMHAFEVLQPLLVLPYAARVLGPHHFGEYAYAISIGQFAATIVDYGFHWTAQRSAASSRGEPAAIAALYADVVATKLLLCLVVTLAGLAAAERFLAISKPMFLCVMLTAIGGVLFPPWLFIGLERAWQAAVASIAARIAALAGFLALVTAPGEVELAVAIQSSIPLASAIISLPFVFRIGLSGFRAMSLSRIALQLREGWRGFLFAFVERASATLPIPLVQHFAGYVAAGQYSVADKFVGATRPFFRVLTETLLPRIAYCARHDPEAGIALIWRSLLTLGVGAMFSLGLFFVAPSVIIVFFGKEFSGAIPIVRVMAVIPLLVNGNICLSNLYMFNYGHERAWSRLTVSGLLVFVAAAYLFWSLLADGAIAVAAAAIAKEALIFLVAGGFFLTFGTAYGRARRRAKNSGLRGAAGPALPPQSARL